MSEKQKGCVYRMLVIVAVLLIILPLSLRRGSAISLPDFSIDLPISSTARLILSTAIMSVTVGLMVWINRGYGPFVNFRFGRASQAGSSTLAAQNRPKKASRFRVLFVYGLIAASVLVILVGAFSQKQQASIEVEPPTTDTENRALDDDGTTFIMFLSMSGLWLTAAVTLVDIALVWYVIRPRNQQLMRGLGDATPMPVLVPDTPSDLIWITDALAARNYTLLGAGRNVVGANYKLIRSWVYANDDGTIFAQLVHVPGAISPAVTLISVLPGNVVVETRHSVNLKIDKPNYVVRSIQGDAETLLNFHDIQLKTFVQEHGSPLTASSLDEYLALVPSLAQSHLPQFERGIMWSWLGGPLMLLILSVGLSLAMIISYEPGGTAVLSCVMLVIIFLDGLLFILIRGFTESIIRSARQMSELVS